MPMATVTIALGEQVDDRRLVAEVIAGFGLGHVSDVRRLTDGLMNRNWRVATSAGVVAVKQILDIDAERARRQHRAVAELAASGFPVPAPLHTPAGETVLDHGDGLFAVLPWVTGAHCHPVGLGLADCAALGTLLASLHAGLARVMPVTPSTVTMPVPEPAKAKDRVDRYLGLIDEGVSLDDFDRHARARLVERRDLLEQFAYLRPAEVPVGPVGWTHGDFHELNLLWNRGRVAAVLDWDRLGPRPLAAEVVRSGTLMFGHGDHRGLDLERVAAFAAGYRAEVWIDDEQLADAARRLWWERLCDFWQLKWHYERGDRSCDHLFVSASALVAWWTDHLDLVTRAFTRG
jgi:homoserine kinase type II